MAEATDNQLRDAVIPDPAYDAGHHYGETQCFSCAFFHELHGEAGGDWGVCVNTRSPRKGLLNFEHFGCAEWQRAPEYA
jgi:hypothetical protein